MPESNVVNNSAASRYELDINGDVARADYRLDGDTITFTHTEVPDHIQERGVGSRIAKFALDDARARNLKVRPNCVFFAQYIEKHPEYRDLLA